MNDIINIERIEFTFPEEHFSIIYEENIWYAEHEDPEKDREILESINDNIIFNQPEYLFENVFLLTPGHFNVLRKIAEGK